MSKSSKKTLIPKQRFHRLHRIKNHPFIVPVTTFIVLFFITLICFVVLGGKTIGASDSRIVKLSSDNKLRVIPTRAKTVGEFIIRANIVIHNGDVVEPSMDTQLLDDNFRINIYRAHPVTILDGEKRIQALSAATTPRSVAAQAGIQVYPEDNISVTSNDNFIKEGVIGQKVVIDRATPAFINLYGTPLSVRTHAKTVADLIKEKNIILAPGDTLQPDIKTTLTANAQIFVVRNGSKLISEEHVIAMPSDTVEDPSLSFGTEAIRQTGSVGKMVVTYQIDLQNGKEVARHEIQSIVVTEPVKEIIARGKAVYISTDSTSIMSAAGISSRDYPYVNYIISRESGWCPTKWQGQVGFCPAYYSQLHDTSSGYGYGLCQSTPAIKMSSSGADWATNPVTQLLWCSGYANTRYHGWGGAYNHWLSYHSW